MTTSLLSNATRTDPLPRSPHPRYAAKPLVRGHFQQRRRREHNKNHNAAGQDVWVSASDWGRVA
jgi:hypothetical protein